jgi:hypothetical protein
MDDLVTWPAPLRAYLAEALGEPYAIDRLGGMSMAAVYRVRAGDTSRIVKASPSPRETQLYEHGGEQLRRAAVLLPECYWLGRLDGVSWLALEDIPTPAPQPQRDIWQPDSRMVETVARIHTLSLHLPAALEALERRRWTDERAETTLVGRVA